jgi:hypothetical protein
MYRRSKGDTGSDVLVDRRTWMVGALTAWVGASCRAGQPDQAQAAEDRERQAVEELGAKAELKAFRTTRSLHYLGIGDASDRFRSITLRDCEYVAADFLDYYRSRGFEVAMPASRLTVIILDDPKSHTAFRRDGQLHGGQPGASQGPATPGYYNPSSNRLVVFDLRSVGSGRTAGLENLRLIAHESTHQLTFNTGMLNRQGDTPRCVVEGLAMYGEKHDSLGHSAPGQLDFRQIGILTEGNRRSLWFPIAQLLVEEQPFFGPRRGLAYAQAWVLIDLLMTDRVRREAFRGYLEAIRPRTDARQRRVDAEKHLGNLDQLDRDVRRHALSLIRGR